MLNPASTGGILRGMLTDVSKEALVKSLIFSCLALCACAHSAEAPDVGNRAPANETPTLEGNVAATVKVYFTFWDTEEHAPQVQSSNGVVVDDRHVLVISVEFSAEFYTELRLTEIRIAPIGVDVEHAPWKAHIAASEGGLTVMETEDPIPRPHVILAPNPPHADETVYALGDAPDMALKIVRGLVVENLRDADTHPERHGIPMAFESVWNAGYGYSLTFSALVAGIYNARHEMIGFGGMAGSSFSPTTEAQKRFFGSTSEGIYLYGTYAPSIASSILPLLQKAGVKCVFP